MATCHDEDKEEGNLSILFPNSDSDQGEEGSGAAAVAVVGAGEAPPEHQQQRFELRSIDGELVIRHQPSQGLSFQLWPAAAALAVLLDAHRLDPARSPLLPFLPNRRPLRLLELGSGTGLAGLAAAAALGADVTLSDLPHVVPNLLLNADSNAAAVASGGGRAAPRALRWGCREDVEGLEFDLVMASDVVYHDHLYQPLLDTLAWLLLAPAGPSAGGGFLMAHLRRWKKETVFFGKARKMFRVTVVHAAPPAAGARRGVVVYHFARKEVGHCWRR